MNRIFITVMMFLLAAPFAGMGQSDRRSVRQGNKLYHKEKYSDAEIRYRQSLEENPQNTRGIFNLGNALYRQGRYEEAADLFEGLSQFAPDEKEKAFAYHNLGNTFLQSQNYSESVEAYKNALRINPEDEQTRFNLAYAMRMLQQQPLQDQGGEGEDEQEKDQDQNQNQQPDDQNEDQSEEKQQPKPDQISPQDAQRILDALNQKEQKVQEDLKREQIQRATGRQEREW
ncbi:MAG: tetratricopeptide repeat protein [Bacteroidales bacterium]|nr:tetratricopeptide repeat protein [Bacteroidales bacterium]NLM93621.1 tetratricopeptide repeat protein [Bacteroidales bacterium]